MKRARVADDYYATPEWCIELILPVLDAACSTQIGCVLDPSCGDGAILDVAKAHGCHTVGIEQDAGRAQQARAKGHSVTEGDALGSFAAWDVAPHTAQAAIIGNPPYSHALEFAERAAAWARRYGRPAALLLRLGFAESAGRAAFHRAYPSSLYVLAERPRFRTDTRGTDSSAYAWFVWGLSPLRSNGWSVLERDKKNAE